MADSQLFNLQGLNTGVNPLLQSQGQFTRLVNVDSDPAGVKKKRPGYITFLGTPDNSKVNSLIDYHRSDGTTFTLLRASGSSLYYSQQGTGDWTLASNGTITNGNTVGYTNLNDVLIVGDGATATRHTTDGISFTNTTLAPIGNRLTNYQGRVYMIGTSNSLFYSVTNDATNWNTSGTSDSSSITIPGAGKLIDVMKVSDRIVTTKNSGVMHRWDGYNLFDLSTKLGPTSPYSIGEIEDYRLYLNRKGYYGFNGANNPQIISHPIRSQVYNDSGSAIVGSVFDNSPAGVFKYYYMNSVGTVTDDFTGETINNCVQTYNYQLNEWSNYSFGTAPTAFLQYKNNSLNEQLLFGDNNGQCYAYGGTATSDAGTPIESIIEFLYHDGNPELEKEWKYYQFIFNPGCIARVQIAFGDTFTKGKKNWISLDPAKNGVIADTFPSGSRGRILFVKITENSIDSRFIFYGCAFSYKPLSRL